MESQKSNNPERILLGGLEYTIPEGFEAEIKDRKIIVRKKETAFERVRKELLAAVEKGRVFDIDPSVADRWVTFLEGLESIGESSAKNCAISFVEFLDKNSNAGKMCVSNLECADIVNAFVEKNWAKLVAYVNKYLRGAAEVRTAPLSSKCQEWIDAVECVAGAFPPGSKGYDMVIGSIHDLIKYLKSHCLENRLWSEDEKNWKAVLEYVKDDALRVWLEKQIEQKPAEWTDADEKILERIINRQKFIIPAPAKDPGGVVFKRSEDTEAINWLKRRVTSQPQPKQEWSEEDEEVFKHLCDYLENERDTAITKFDKASFAEFVQWLEKRLKALRPQPNNNLRWRRATEGANLPESIIIPDGEEPRFGKCAVKNSYYIPVEELKNLPKDEKLNTPDTLPGATRTSTR